MNTTTKTRCDLEDAITEALVRTIPGAESDNLADAVDAVMAAVREEALPELKQAANAIASKLTSAQLRVIAGGSLDTKATHASATAVWRHLRLLGLINAQSERTPLGVHVGERAAQLLGI